MPLSSAPVQLLNLSVSQLQKLATQAGLAPAATTTKIALIRLLVESLEPSVLLAAADDYLYAGKTSVSWIQFADGPIRLNELKTAIVSVCGADPFASNLEPILGNTPQLLQARSWRNDKVVLTFAVRGNERLVFQGYQLTEVSEDISFPAIFRLNDAVLEVRSAGIYVQKMLRNFVSQLEVAMNRKAEQLPISEVEFDALRGILGASLTDYTGMDESPSPYRTRSVTKKPTCVDLAAEPAFQLEYGGLDAVKGEIAFLDAAAEDVSALVAIRSSSVYFRSAASETTIDTVYEALATVWP